LNWSDFHPGITEYLYHRQGWPMTYACLGDMPYEVSEVFDYMLRTEKAAQQDDGGASLAAAVEVQQAQMRRLYEGR
jgi:hypothetical protein